MPIPEQEARMASLQRGSTGCSCTYIPSRSWTKHLNPCSSREQNAGGCKNFSAENGKRSAREMAFFVRLQQPSLMYGWGEGLTACELVFKAAFRVPSLEAVLTAVLTA